MIGRVGADDFGARLRAHLEESGVDARAVLVDAVAGSGMSAAIVRGDGEYGAVIVSGANLNIAPRRAADAWREIGGARVLVLQNEIPEAANLAVAQAARATGAIVILNAAPARALPPALRRGVDILVVNRVEAEMMSGENLGDDAGAQAALAKLGAAYANVILTLGADGLLVKAADGAVARIAAKPVAVVSAHGAGDCFVGALAAKMAQGGSLRQAAEFANAAAAAHVAGGRD
jgi:ribokinase